MAVRDIEADRTVLNDVRTVDRRENPSRTVRLNYCTGLLGGRTAILDTVQYNNDMNGRNYKPYSEG